MARFCWSARIDPITYANEFVYGAVPRVLGKVLFVAYFRGVSLLEVMRVYDWSNLQISPFNICDGDVIYVTQ